MKQLQQLLKGKMYDLTIMLFLQEFHQIHIQNPVEHLRWIFLRKLSMAKSS